ncbi:MAG: CapA family protein [Acidimicrobiales bacterium]
MLGRTIAVVALGLATARCSSTPPPAQGLREVTRPWPSTITPPLTPASPPPTQASSPRRTFTLALTGDLLIHSPVARAARTDGAAPGDAYDFGPMFDEVRPILSGADLALCHQETPISADDSDLSGYPLFNAPRELAAAIAGAGYDQCSTASNHSFDKGVSGVEATIAGLQQAGVATVGTARDAAGAASPPVTTVNGVRVAHLAYSYGLNGLELPADQPWLVNLIDVDRILADAWAARATGARFVAVSLQWGEEYRVEPTAEQETIATQLLSSPDVDLIVGSHVHVVQPIARVGDKYVVYGLGNFLSNQTAACCPAASQDGVIVLVTVSDEGGVVRVTDVTYEPTWVEHPGFVVRAVATALADPATAAERADLEASWQRTVAAISSLGADNEGVVPARPAPG